MYIFHVLKEFLAHGENNEVHFIVQRISPQMKTMCNKAGISGFFSNHSDRTVNVSVRVRRCLMIFSKHWHQNEPIENQIMEIAICVKTHCKFQPLGNVSCIFHFIQYDDIFVRMRQNEHLNVHVYCCLEHNVI